MSFAVVWQNRAEQLALSGKVVRRADWARVLSSVQTLEKTEALASAGEARALAAERAAASRGHAAGLALGREEGLHQVLVQLHEKERFIAGLHGELVALVEHAVSGLLAAAGEQALLSAQVERAVEAARHRAGARLLVAPQRVQDAHALLQQWLGDAAPPWLQVQGDDSLTGCDIVVEAEGAIFDGRLHAQVERWRSAVATVLAGTARGPDEH